jgi:hypothetical protein
MKRFSVGRFLKFVVMAVACVALLGFVTMSLWNWLVPVLFSGPIISFWQALGLLLLSKLLLSGFGRGGGPWGEKGHQRWKEKMKAKMQHMSVEEKARFKQNLSKCMGGRWAKLEEDEEKQQPGESNKPVE